MLEIICILAGFTVGSVLGWLLAAWLLNWWFRA